MAFRCLADVGCIKDYVRKGIRKPISEPTLLPWVEVWIEGGGKKIGVSNSAGRTLPGGNGPSLATIKSFQFGMSNGNGVNVEIVDEEGGEFVNFFNKISTGNLESSSTKYVLKFRFGWATMGCDRVEQTFGAVFGCPVGSIEPNRAYQSTIHTMVIRTINVNVSHGMFKYSIEATDLTMDMFTTRSFKSVGTNRQGIPVTQAIRELFSQFGVEVDFRRLISPCETGPMRFNVDSNHGCAPGIDPSTQGPCAGPWRSAGLNPVQAATSWLMQSGAITEQGRGIVRYWDSTRPRPTLIFLETNIPTCNNLLDSDQYNLGTFIVNGGACSPVISFTPEIKYTMPQAFSGTGGTTGDAMMPSAYREQEPCLRGSTHTLYQGFQATMVPTEIGYILYGSTGLQTLTRAKLINSSANLLSPPITAELRIQGDPSFDTPVLFHGHYVSVVYINPYRIVRTGNGCDYLSMGCQRQLSNTNWMIIKIYHEIKEGAYTTTLKLQLAAPGMQIGRNSPLGAMPGAPTIGR